ncbi:hypothetical protein [Psychroflexus lacisalsi]|jgi:ABC-type phosphate transport system auxiliary subunit|uniref:Uncharacterized protein n=1 Tax=Psychroflexus lacisalsi TaxID=503928 RepID=A0ABP3VGG9_9FLAO|nr:hypothetical protein [Psychroflexus lacisalsi]MBZ9618908.1 hypothetical protein [Psychroflexus lacisalsi]
MNEQDYKTNKESDLGNRYFDKEETLSITKSSHNIKSNKLNLLVTILVVLSLMVGCNSSNKDGETTSEDLQKEMNDVMKVSKEYGAEKWKNLSDRIEELRSDIEVKTEEAERNYNNLSDDLQDKYLEEKQKMTQRQAELRKKLNEFEKASGEKKEELKSEVIQLKTALDKSINAFEKEMEESRN